MIECECGLVKTVVYFGNVVGFTGRMYGGEDRFLIGV